MNSEACFNNRSHKRYDVVILVMSEWKDKTPEQVSDEDYKVAPTSSDKQAIDKAKSKETATGENYQLPPESRVRGNEKAGRIVREEK